MDRASFIAQSIMRAKKVMDKVETNTYSRGHVDESKITLSADLLEAPPPGAKIPAVQIPRQSVPLHNTNNPAQTKLPKGVMESFAKEPSIIAKFTGINTMDPRGMNHLGMNQIVEATKKIQQPTSMPKKKFQQQQEIMEGFESQADPELEAAYHRQMEQLASQHVPVVPHAAQSQGSYYQQPTIAPTLSEDYIKFIVSETVKQTVKAVLEEINKPSNVDENIQIRIGGKTFGGKIKTLKEVVKK